MIRNSVSDIAHTALLITAPLRRAKALKAAKQQKAIANIYIRFNQSDDHVAVRPVD